MTKLSVNEFQNLVRNSLYLFGILVNNTCFGQNKRVCEEAIKP